MAALSPVHTERVASRRNQICLIFGSVDVTRRVRCEGLYSRYYRRRE